MVEEPPATIIAGARRHWRTVNSATVTYALRKGVLDVLKAADWLPTASRVNHVLINPKDDYQVWGVTIHFHHCSLQGGGKTDTSVVCPPPQQNSIDLLEQHGIAIWGPMPSLSAHLNKGFDDADAPTSSSAFLPEQSLYFDYFDFAKALLKQAAHTRPPVVLGP